VYSKQISASTGKKPKTGYRQDIASPFVTTTLLSPTTFNSAAIPRNSAAVSVGFSSSCHRLHHTLLLLPSITLALHLYTTVSLPLQLLEKKQKTSSKKATLFLGVVPSLTFIDRSLDGFQWAWGCRLGCRRRW
jgi:hypothetical protein